MVGEPQNLIIADKASWGFAEFFIRMAPITLPVFVFGLMRGVLIIIDTMASTRQTRCMAFCGYVAFAFLQLSQIFTRHQKLLFMF